MNAQTNIAVVEPRRSLLVEMATRYGMEPKAFADTIRATVVPAGTSNEEFAAFLMVAKEYDLNPLLKEIYAFPKRGGGIQPIVSIDGWCNLINSHPKLNGIEFDDHLDGGKVTSITCRIWRKDREKPIVVTEYAAECVRATDTWKQYPRRMLRHKALIQCARYAFGFAGIVDPDEAERMGADVSPMRDATRDNGPPPPPRAITQQAAVELIESGRDDGQKVEWTETSETASPSTAPTETAMDQQGEKEWLNDLSGAFSSCENIEQFSTKQRDCMAPKKGHVTPEAWTAAQRLAEDTYHRVKDN